MHGIAAPTTSVTAPLANATIKGTVSANATDDVDITLVEFYFDGVRFASYTVAPYSVSCFLDSRGVSYSRSP